MRQTAASLDPEQVAKLTRDLQDAWADEQDAASRAAGLIDDLAGEGHHVSGPGDLHNPLHDDDEDVRRLAGELHDAFADEQDAASLASSLEQDLRDLGFDVSTLNDPRP